MSSYLQGTRSWFHLGIFIITSMAFDRNDSEEFFLLGGKLIWTIRNPKDSTLYESPPFRYLTAAWQFSYGSGLDFEHHSCWYGVCLSKCSKENAKVPFDITLTVQNSKMETIYHDTTDINGADEQLEPFGWDADNSFDLNEDKDEVIKMKFEFHCILKESYPVLQVKSDEGKFSRLGYPCIDSFIEDMKGLLTDSSSCDLELKCEDGSVKAHKNILSARSKVLAAMLKHDVMQNGTGESRCGVMQIPDMNVEDLKKLLHYIYTATLPDLTMDDAHLLYEASDKYAVLGLKRRCAKFMTNNFSAENVCDILVAADLHSDKDFKEEAIFYIVEEKVHLKQEIWTVFSERHPDLATEVSAFCSRSATEVSAFCSRSASDKAPLIVHLGALASELAE